MTDLIDANVADLLPALIGKAADGDEIAVFEALLAQIPASTPPASAKSTVATRRAAQRQAIEEFDLDRLIDLQDKMAKIIDVITANELNADGGVLTGEQATDLMAEFLDERDITELLTERRDMIKAAVFAHLDVTEGRGQNGAIEVPEKGKKFCREGAGSGTPAVDEQRLQALLGERWLDACEETIVPEVHIEAHIEYRLSVGKVLDLAQRDKAVLEALRTCLVPGKEKTPKFTVRDL